MAKNIQVILLENIEDVGQAGDIVTVSEGYARNSLFPAGQAALATEGTKQAQSRTAAQQDKAKQQQLAAAQEQAAALDGTELTIEARLKEGNDIFGSITATQIAKELNQQAKLTLKAKDVNLAQPIATTGSHSVVVHFSPDAEATIQVTVVPEPGSEPDAVEEE